jgi:putative ATP-dependent endonuclease of OLD family
MKIRSIELRNFRCFRNEVIEFGDFTPMVGANNSGKSTVLKALDIFFQSSPKSIPITARDFHISRPKGEPLEIRLIFDNLSTEEENDFGHYARGGQLQFILRAQTDNEGNVSASILGARRGRVDLAPYFEATNATDKKKVYDELQKSNLVSEPWKSESVSTRLLTGLDQEEPSKWSTLESSDKAYGAVGPVGRIRKYLDWIYVPAVKDAADEASENKNSAFGKLALKAVRDKADMSADLAALQQKFNQSLQETLLSGVQPLLDLGYELTKEFQALTSSGLGVEILWDDTKNAIELEHPLIKTQFKDGALLLGPQYIGHGIQRTYIMALLPLVARYHSSATGGPQLILGIEEPELYQHPPQARFLAESLTRLSERQVQVIFTTHSPFFVNARRFDQIRVLRRTHQISKVTSWSMDQHRSYYARQLGAQEIGREAAISSLDRLLHPTISEIFFCNRVVLVEGQEDVAILTAYLKKRGLWSDFLRLGATLVPTSGKMVYPSLMSLCRGLSIPHYMVFDFDMKQKPKDRGNDNLRKFIAELGVLLPEEISNDVFEDSFTCWANNIQTSLEGKRRLRPMEFPVAG